MQSIEKKYIINTPVLEIIVTGVFFLTIIIKITKIYCKSNIKMLIYCICNINAIFKSDEILHIIKNKMERRRLNVIFYE